MSKLPLPHRGTRSLLKAPLWSALIAAVVLLLVVSVCAVRSVKAIESQKARLLPAGQFQADARTLVAALGFLFDSNPVSNGPEVPVGSAALCASNVNLQPLTSGSVCCTSNQSELFSELITNVPARS